MDDPSRCYRSTRTPEEPEPSRDTMTGERTLDIQVWKQVFQELMQEVKTHQWTLEWDKDLLPDAVEPGWTQYRQKAFARFQCSSCSRQWASAQIQVLFHMRWKKKKRHGQVKMRVFAQRCKKCPASPFEVPEFTMENVSRILNNLVLRILQKCYKEGFKPVEEVSVIQGLELEGPHDCNNCEACLQGFCAQSGSGPAMQRPSSPHPYGEMGDTPTPQAQPRLSSTEDPKASDHPKIWPTSPTRQALSTSTVNPKSNPPKTDPSSQLTSRIQQILSTSTVNPKASDHPKIRPTSPTQQALSTPTVKPKSNPSKDSHTSLALTSPTVTVTPKSNPPKTDPSGQQTSHTEQILSILMVNPKASDHPKIPPTSSTRQALSTPTVNPKSNPPKTHPKVSHTSTAPTSPTWTGNPKVPIFPDADPKLQHTSNSPTAPTWRTQPATHIVNPQISKPHRGGLQDHHTSRPSTLPASHIPPVSLPHPGLDPRTATPKTTRVGDTGWRSARPYLPTASPSCPTETYIHIGQAHGYGLAGPRTCRCCPPCGQGGLCVILLVVILVVLHYWGII